MMIHSQEQIFKPQDIKRGRPPSLKTEDDNNSVPIAPCPPF